MSGEDKFTNTQELDGERAEAFAGQMMGVLNNGMLALMMSLGHQTGLFDTMAAMPPSTSENIFVALQPGGTLLMVDVAASSHLHENMEHPLGPFLYTISTMQCMTVSLEQCGEGLGAVWGEQKATQMLEEAGFTDVQVRQVEGDILNNYYIATKS